MKNVYWFLLDGLSPVHLHSCGGKQNSNYIDELIDKSVVFTNVASTAAGTHSSMHSIFTSLFPSVNGTTRCDISSLRKFNRECVTLTDLFFSKGYRTFRYDDSEGERGVPMSGFEVWESGGRCVGEFQGTFKSLNCERRKLFFDRVIKTSSPKFMYYHMELFHDINGKLGNSWPSEKYDKNVIVLAEELKNVIEELMISDDDVIVISSDHGCVLDKDWQNDWKEYGERHYEESVTTFFSILSKELVPKKISKLISSIDEAPTLYEFLFNEHMCGQGLSRLAEIYVDGSTPDLPVFREKVTLNNNLDNSYKTDCFYVKDKDWKYVYSTKDSRSEWLINLRDGDYKINRKDEFQEKAKFYRSLINKTLNYAVDIQKDVYKHFPKTLDKRSIPPIFTIIIDNCEITQDIYDYICDLGGAYYQVLFVNCNIKFDISNIFFFTKIIDEEMISQHLHKSKYIVELYNLENIPEQLLSDLFCIFCDSKKNEILDFGYGKAYRVENDKIDKKIKKIKIRDRYDVAVKKELEKYDYKSIEISIKRILHHLIKKYNNIAIYGNGE